MRATPRWPRWCGRRPACLLVLEAPMGRALFGLLECECAQQHKCQHHALQEPHALQHGPPDIQVMRQRGGLVILPGFHCLCRWLAALGLTGLWHASAALRAQDATADGWRILEDYRIFLTSRSQEATAATEAVRNRWRNEARLHPAPC